LWSVCLSTSVPDTWAKFSDNNIRRSQSERQASRDLRNNIEQLCNTATASLMNEWNAANTALADRVKEYTEARNQLQTHLAKVSMQQFIMEVSAKLAGFQQQSRIDFVELFSASVETGYVKYE